MIAKVKGSLVALALALSVASASTPAGAQTAAPGLAGTWTAAGSGLVQIVIAAAPGGATVTAFGSCHPTACPWGTRPLQIFAPNVSATIGSVGFATYTTTFSKIRLIVTLTSARTLRVETLTNFTDNSGRSNYVSTVIMH
jgi:hypothetical protein